MNTYKCFELDRDADGVLTVRFHSRGGPMTWTAVAHREAPTLFAAMLNDESLKNEPRFPALRLCTSAGEALPEAVGKTWQQRFGVDIIDGVGSTELLHIFLSN